MKLRCTLPLAMSFVLVIALAVGLSCDSRELSSPLVNKLTPVFRLTMPESTTGPLTLRDPCGRIWILNVWVSWCIACRTEHAVLNVFVEQSVVPIYDLGYKGGTDATHAWLKQTSDPYITSPIDADDKVGIDYGAYGVPETFIIDRADVVRYWQVGPVVVESMKRRVVPLLQQLEQEDGHV